MKRILLGILAAFAAMVIMILINTFIKDIISDFLAGWLSCIVYFAVILWNADVTYKDKTKQQQ